MKPISVTTSILTSTLIGAALLAIGGLGFSTTPGEMSKLTYDGNLWCVSNWVDDEDPQGNRTYLPDPDGRPVKDRRLKGKEDWIRVDQVSAETKEEAEQKATRQGLFEPSEKVALRDALDQNNKEFFTSHFNTGATAPGPCLGSGMGDGIVGKWINDAIREDCFETPTPTADTPLEPGTGQSVGGICVGGKGVPEAYAKIFAAAGQKFGVHPAWLAAIFAAENGIASGHKGRISVGGVSRWPSMNKSWSTSWAGAQGPMQFMPGTWRGHKQDGNGDGVKDVQNIYDAIYGSAHLIRYTANVPPENPTEAQMRRSGLAYNAGPRNALKPESQLVPEAIDYIYKTREAFKRYNCK